MVDRTLFSRSLPARPPSHPPNHNHSPHDPLLLSLQLSHNDCLRWIADLRACDRRSDAALRVPCGSAVRRRERNIAASDGVHGAVGIGLPCQCASGSCGAASPGARQPSPRVCRDRRLHPWILRSSRLAVWSLLVEQVLPLSRRISRFAIVRVLMMHRLAQPQPNGQDHGSHLGLVIRRLVLHPDRVPVPVLWFHPSVDWPGRALPIDGQLKIRIES